MTAGGVDADLLAGALLPVLLAAILLGAAVGGSLLKPDTRRRIERGLKLVHSVVAAGLFAAAAYAIYGLVRSGGRWSVNWWEFTAAFGAALILQLGWRLSRRDRLKS